MFGFLASIMRAGHIVQVWTCSKQFSIFFVSKSKTLVRMDSDLVTRAVKTMTWGVYWVWRGVRELDLAVKYRYECIAGTSRQFFYDSTPQLRSWRRLKKLDRNVYVFWNGRGYRLINAEHAVFLYLARNVRMSHYKPFVIQYRFFFSGNERPTSMFFHIKPHSCKKKIWFFFSFILNHIVLLNSLSDFIPSVGLLTIQVRRIFTFFLTFLLQLNPGYFNQNNNTQ